MGFLLRLVRRLRGVCPECGEIHASLPNVCFLKLGEQFGWSRVRMGGSVSPAVITSIFSVDLRQRFGEGCGMEGVIEQGELFPVIEEKTKKRSLLRQYVEATLVHGPLATPAMCAAAMGISRQRIHTLIEQGRIAVLELDGNRYIPAPELERFLCEERKTGRHLDYHAPETFREFIGDYVRVSRK